VPEAVRYAGLRFGFYRLADLIYRYIGGFISRLVSLGTKWDMLASRKILLKHFNARAGEYHAEIFSGDEGISETRLDQTDDPV
jgi:hypothetical protein